MYKPNLLPQIWWAWQNNFRMAINSVAFGFHYLFLFLLKELLVNRNNDLSKLKIRKLFASQEGRWWLLIDWLIDWLLQMTCYVITTIVSANWKYKNFFASHGDMTLWWHYYYLLRGADDDMRKEDCISSESRLILGPVVEISNLKYFDNLLKNFIIW